MSKDEVEEKAAPSVKRLAKANEMPVADLLRAINSTLGGQVELNECGLVVVTMSHSVAKDWSASTIASATGLAESDIVFISAPDPESES